MRDDHGRYARMKIPYMRKMCVCGCKGEIVVSAKTIRRVGVDGALKINLLPGHAVRMKKRKWIDWDAVKKARGA